MSERLLLSGIVLNALSGILGLPFGRRSMKGQWVATFLAVLGSCLGLTGVIRFWTTRDSQPIAWHYLILDQLGGPGVEVSAAIDGLSAVFLVPIFLISLLGNIYGLGYWKQTHHPENGRKLRLFYGALTAGMALLVIARDSIVFLVGWEIMALSAFFLVATEDEDEEVRASGWIYLAASHGATLCLFALFALMRVARGSFAFGPLDTETCPSGMATAIFILALIGFGLKAGLMPLHIWLPGAHANAPSHVSAIMSGVLIKMGVYGFVRVMSLFPHPPVSWGGIILALGTFSGVLGVAFAIGQHDLKRLLAYHSIENIGIIFMGIGLALLGRALGKVDWIILGFFGALLHVWNHALFKSLLFFSAGSVVDQIGRHLRLPHALAPGRPKSGRGRLQSAREIDRLGGLAKRMPWTALGFLIGAVAICGLPPLNGFVSEWCIYLGLFRTLGGPGGPRSSAGEVALSSVAQPSVAQAGAALAAPALALIGALAVACFVKVYGVVFLGTARSEAATQTQESSASMLGPMAVLGAFCFLIGVAPLLIVSPLELAVSRAASDIQVPNHRLLELARLDWITTTGLMLLAALALVGTMMWLRFRRSVVEPGPTWGCGYVAPTPRMQYTASSFAQMIVALFAWALRERRTAEVLKSSDEFEKKLPLFPKPTRFHSEVPDVVLDEAVLPAFRAGAWLFSAFRVFQRGSIQAYVLYIFIALLALLIW